MGDTVNILVVDDDDAIRETLRFALEDAGYQVSEAPEGMAALRLLRSTRDRMVVLLDLMMPGLDGAGVLGAVAGDHQLTTQHSYILLTANTRTLTLAFANLLSNLQVPTLRKPFDIDDLLKVIARASGRLAEEAV
jgi:CheY-like chemotaxis protein